MAILTVKYGPIFISSRASMCNLKLTIEKKKHLEKRLNGNKTYAI